MNERTMPLGLTYDDVLLIPQKSRISSRKMVETTSKISRHIDIAIPFISSNVDTVTESAMAIVMAKLGGLGIIHRFMSIADESEEVRRVKRSEGFVMGAPFTVQPNASVSEVRLGMKRHRVTSAIVVDSMNKVLGLVSERDMWFLDSEALPIQRLMTPQERLITASIDTSLSEARKLFKKHKVEKLPLLKKDGTLGGLITSRTVVHEEIYPLATKDGKGRLRVGAAVGVIGDFRERAKALIDAGVDLLVVDIAHVHSIHGLKAIRELRKLCQNVDLIAGNVATREAARELIHLGCDGMKVGIGPGGICITRIVAGAGVPQFTALSDCSSVCHKANVPYIADGGTNYPGDMTKALAAGASSVMLTGWLAGTDESPGNIIMRKGQKYKIHRGAASFTAVASRKIAGVSGQIRKEVSEQVTDQDLEEIVPEGVETFVPYKGGARDVISQLVGAVRSGMSYANARTIPELWRHARFMQITSAGFRESKQHNVEEM
ncbi:MAG: IMP dehydrogenase [bacterium]|nr:IMP dehydrogenase [bacterium]